MPSPMEMNGRGPSRRTVALCAAAATLLLCNTAAHAHSGGGGGHVAGGAAGGLLHPLTGLDHLLAMLAAGIWAAQVGGRAVWQLPMAFVAGMALGGAAAHAGVRGYAVEPAVALSVVLLGLCVALAVRVKPWVAIGATCAFAVFHGHAHVVEMPADGSVAVFMAGMLLTTAALTGASAWATLAVRRQAEEFVRFGGALVSAAGVLIAVGVG